MRSSTHLMAQYRQTGDISLLKQFYASAEYAQKRIARAARPKRLAKYSLLVKEMNLKAGDSVLDVGSGPPTLRGFVEGSGASYTSLDINPHFSPDICADVSYLCSICDNSFTWVVLADVLEHLPHPEEVLQQVHRIGSRVIAVVPNWYRLECLPGLPRSPTDHHIVRHRPAAWLRMVEQSGGVVDLIAGFYYVPSFAFNSRIRTLRQIDKWLKDSMVVNKLASILQRTIARRPMLKYLGQELILVARRATPEDRLPT